VVREEPGICASWQSSLECGGRKQVKTSFLAVTVRSNKKGGVNCIESLLGIKHRGGGEQDLEKSSVIVCTI